MIDTTVVKKIYIEAFIKNDVENGIMEIAINDSNEIDDQVADNLNYVFNKISTNLSTREIGELEYRIVVTLTYDKNDINELTLIAYGYEIISQYKTDYFKERHGE